MVAVLNECPRSSEYSRSTPSSRLVSAVSLKFTRNRLASIGEMDTSATAPFGVEAVPDPELEPELQLPRKANPWTLPRNKMTAYWIDREFTW